MKTGSVVGVAAAALLFTLPGCRSERPAVPLRPAMPSGGFKVLLDAERVAREGLAAPATGFEWALPEGARGRLRFSWTAAGRRGAVSLETEVLAEGGRPPGKIGSVNRLFPENGPPVFFDEDLALSAPRGARLRLSTTPAGELFLSDLRIVQPNPSADALVLLVFDTTRRDAVGLYGCPDPSTPNLDAIFGGGFKAERAYASASWTIPSVASLLTGRVPAVHEGGDGAPRGIVPGVVTLAEDFRRAGWSTGAFVANPTLRAENGFAAGFTTFFTTPYEGTSIVLPGSETVKHVPRWLSARQGEHFVLLLLLMDPHDPYTPADRPRGVTPFDPGYTGPIVGDEIHRLQIGLLPRPSDRDIRHLTALYRDEVRLADRFFGELWSEFQADLGRRATLVFTSDHGEELGEHGGWKHGPSLFDEVLRIPLLIRPGNGRRLLPLPAGTLVSLLDVLPTVEALLLVPAPFRPLDGTSLLEPEAARREVLPPVTMLTGGPPRAAVVRKEAKLVFFDRLGSRGVPHPVKDPDGYRLAKRLAEILPAFGRYDLASDPAEKTLLPADEASFAADWRAIEYAWSGTRDGLEIRILGGPAKLSLKIEGFPRDARAEPLGRKEADRIRWDCRASGCALEAELHLAGDVEGFSVSGQPSDLTITADGGCAALGLSEPRPLTSGRAEAIPRNAIGTSLPRFAHLKGCMGIFLWRSLGRRDLPQDTDEAVKKLRALGYLH
jgi:arylsulfatase A-like enzyme